MGEFVIRTRWVSLISVFIHRYRIIIHAGVDGATRLVVFANASGNNRASTVLEYFTKAAAEFGKSIMLHGISLLCYLCYVCNVVGQVDMFSSTATCII